MESDTRQFDEIINTQPDLGLAENSEYYQTETHERLVDLIDLNKETGQQTTSELAELVNQGEAQIEAAQDAAASAAEAAREAARAGDGDGPEIAVKLEMEEERVDSEVWSIRDKWHRVLTQRVEERMELDRVQMRKRREREQMVLIE